MLKWYAETFKLSGKQLTSAALKRIKWLTILSLPAFPLVMTRIFFDVPEALAVPFWTAFTVSLISLLCLCFTKFVNRFWARDRYLDEWEKGRKHQAMAFAFQILCYSSASLMVFGILSDAFSVFENIGLQSLGIYEIGVVAAGVMTFGFYIMHLYLIFTVKPIDELEKRDSVLEAAH